MRKNPVRRVPKPFKPLAEESAAATSPAIRTTPADVQRIVRVLDEAFRELGRRVAYLPDNISFEEKVAITDALSAGIDSFLYRLVGSQKLFPSSRTVKYLAEAEKTDRESIAKLVALFR